MKRALRIFDKALDTFVVVLCLAMCIVVIWQVVSRFLLHIPAGWSEEIARYLLSWVAFLGSAIGIREGAHMCLVFVTEKIKSLKLRTVIHIFDYAVCILVGYIFVRYGYEYALSGFGRTMMAVKVPMAYIYSVVPSSGVIIIINSLRLIYADVLVLKSNKGV